LIDMAPNLVIHSVNHTRCRKKRQRHDIREGT
jgi:hypothetical protein